MLTTGARYLRLLAEASALATTPRWTDGPRTEAEIDASLVRGSRATFTPSPIPDELMQIMLDLDSLGAAVLRGGLPRWATDELDLGVLTALLALREHRATTDVEAASKLQNTRPEAARRALRAWAMPDEGPAAEAIQWLLGGIQLRLNHFEDSRGAIATGHENTAL